MGGSQSFDSRKWSIKHLGLPHGDDEQAGGWEAGMSDATRQHILHHPATTGGTGQGRGEPPPGILQSERQRRCRTEPGEPQGWGPRCVCGGVMVWDNTEGKAKEKDRVHYD